MAKLDVLFTKTRVDVHVHPRTEWFSEREHWLRELCQCANQLGIIEMSLASIARKASGDGQTMTVTAEEIRASIARLSQDGHVVWFGDVEVLWWVNVADEQKPNSQISDYWDRIRVQILPKFNAQVRASICAKYPLLESDNPPESLIVDTEHGNQVGLFGSLDRDRDQDSEQDQEREKRSRQAPTSARPRRKSRSRSRAALDQVPAEFIEQVIECFNAHRAKLQPNAKGYRADSNCHRKPIAVATVREGATLDDWRERIDRLAQAASREDFWVQHFTPAYLHQESKWEKWSHDSAIPPKRATRTARHTPSSFDGPDRSFGIDFGDEEGGSDAA